MNESSELDNLRKLLEMTPDLIPPIVVITDSYYVMEKCEVIKPEDFEPSNFYRLVDKLLVSLYKFKKEGFTPGIYKYFEPYNLNCKMMEQSYIPYLMNKFVEMIQYISVKFPKLLEDVIFNNLVKHLKNNSKYFKNWKPSGGYSLLHGDLHIGNIVKRNGNYLLIDFEYLRYGATEFEIANLIISSLFWYCKRNYDDNKLKSLITNYFKTCIQFSFLNNYIFFKFFFIFSLILYYLSAYIGKKGKDDLATIRKIIRLNNIVNQGYKY